MATNLGRTSASPREDKILAPGGRSRGLLYLGHCGKGRLVLGGEEGAVGIEEGADHVGAGE